jgi:hypothetical protein
MERHGARRFRWLVLVMCLALAVAACAADEPDVAEDPDVGEDPEDEVDEPEAAVDPEFYAGETITILVPAAPGGGADRTAQFNAPYFQEYIPGNPSVAVEHDTAAGGIAAGNRYFNAMEPDGYTVFLSAFTTTIPWLVGEAEVEYDVAALDIIAAFPFTGLLYVDPDTGITSVEDLPEHADQLIKGGVSPTSTDIMGVLALEVLGVREDIQEIWGYGGTGDHVLAFQQGETNFDATTNAVWYGNQWMEEDGDAIPIVAYGFLQDDGTFARDPLVPDVPTVDEAHEILYGEPPSGEAWEAFQNVMSVIHVAHSLAMHPDAPPEALATIRAGIIEAIEEGDYVEQWLEASPAEPFYTEEDIEMSQEAIRAVPDDFVDWIQNWLEENYPDEFG